MLPLQPDSVLIGTADWEGALGVNVTRGYRFGTLMWTLALAYDGDGVEYLKRVSPKRRLLTQLEGEPDEPSLVGEAQYKPTNSAVLKLNTGIGLTEKAPDGAPEVGVIFSF